MLLTVILVIRNQTHFQRKQFFVTFQYTLFILMHFAEVLNGMRH